MGRTTNTLPEACPSPSCFASVPRPCECYRALVHQLSCSCKQADCLGVYTACFPLQATPTEMPFCVCGSGCLPQPRVVAQAKLQDVCCREHLSAELFAGCHRTETGDVFNRLPGDVSKAFVTASNHLLDGAITCHKGTFVHPTDHEPERGKLHEVPARCSVLSQICCMSPALPIMCLGQAHALCLSP